MNARCAIEHKPIVRSPQLADEAINGVKVEAPAPIEPEEV